MLTVHKASQTLAELASHLNAAATNAKNAVDHLDYIDPDAVENYMGNAIDYAKTALGGLRTFVESAKKVDKWNPRSRK